MKTGVKRADLGAFRLDSHLRGNDATGLMKKMRHVFVFLTVFALISVLSADEVPAAPLESVGNKADFSLLPERPIFSVDTDIYLGQKRGGGRVWANCYYGDTTLKPTEGYKIQPDFYGLQLGFDLAKGRGVYSSYFLNLNHSKTKFGGASSDIDNFLLGYGSFYYMEICHLTFTSSIGYDKYEISAGGKHDGNGLQTNFFGEIGLDFVFGKWAFKPFYALQYDFLYHGNIGTVIKDENDHGLNQLFGLRSNWKVFELLEMQSRTVWVHEMLDNPPPFYHARFSPVHGIQTPAITFFGGNTGRDWVWLGIGGTFDVSILKAYIDYDLMLNERHVTHLGSFGLCLGW